MELVCAIGFDLDHTLAIDNRLERVALLHLLESLLVQGGRTVGTLSDEIDGIEELLSRQRHGEFSIDDAVRRFVADHQLQPSIEHVESFRYEAVAMVDDFVVPLPGVKPALQALRDRGIALAVLTNGWNPLQTRKAQRTGFSGPVLVSSEIGVQKPSPQSFEMLLSVLGTQPQQTWYVGDNPRSDVAGAQQLGLRTVWVNWEHQTYPPELAPPDHTIAEFDELIALLPTAVRTA